MSQTIPSRFYEEQGSRMGDNADVTPAYSTISGSRPGVGMSLALMTATKTK